MGGVVLPDYNNVNQASPIGPSSPINTFGAPNTFSSAVNTNAADYDKIMKSYDDLLSTAKSNPSRPTPISPQISSYNPSSNVSSSLSNLSSLSSSGGYTPAGIADIRARSLSPIRSIYANAQQKLDRQKSLQSGYSPNYTAATTRMARELSEELAAKTTDVEAGIAQNVAQNKLSIAPSWASAAAAENNARMQVEQHNADVINQVNELNAKMSMDANNTNFNNMFGAVEGMRGLYQSSPGLANTFGNQVVQAAQLGQGQQQINRGNQNNALDFASRFGFQAG